MSDASTFLQALWSSKPKGTAVQLWRKSDSKNFTFQVFDPAVDWIEGNGKACDIYMAAGLVAKAATPSKQRGTSRSVVAIAGAWADIDVVGGPARKTGVAPSREEAHSLAESLCVPTVVVDSGYGLQAWWLFEEVWPFYTEEERGAAANIVSGFQGALRAEAKRRGYTIDSTQDLARLMRVPGGFNHKGDAPAAVTLVDDGGPRYSRTALEEIGREHQKTSSSLNLITGEAVDISITATASPPMEKLDLLRDMDADFKSIWEHKTTNKTKSWSMSEFEFSLTNYFVQVGWSDQEICDALVYFRNRYEPGDPKGKNRVDRISQTIGKVRATTNHKREQEVVEARRGEAVDELAAISEESGLDPVVTLGLFNRVLGGPEVKELVQYGRDPETSRYVLMLANGDEVPLGPIAIIWSQDQFMQKFAVVTRFVGKSIDNKKWKMVLQALLNTAVLKDDEEDTRSHRAWEMVLAYVERRYSTDRNLACQSYDPFVMGGELYVPLGPFHQYLRRVRGERIADVDLRQYLEAAGFERKNINYTRDDGKKSTRSYFRAPWEGI